MVTPWTLIPLFFLTALVYSMVGFGGGSTYLALLILFAVPYEVVPETALICNLIVVGGSSYHFWRHFSSRHLLPFVVASVPFAYLGGTIPISKELFQLLVGLSLLVVAIRLLFINHSSLTPTPPSWKRAWVLGVPTGAVLGGLSGLIGIGGGIFLSPLLMLLKWADAKQAAAAASLFILVNSFAGLIGQVTKSGLFPELHLWVPLGLSVLIGGQLGSRWGSGPLSTRTVQQVTAMLILVVSVRLLLKNLL